MEISKVNERWYTALEEAGVSEFGIREFKRTFSFFMLFADEGCATYVPLVGAFLVGFDRSDVGFKDWLSFEIDARGLNTAFYQTLRFMQDTIEGVGASNSKQIFGLSRGDLETIAAINIRKTWEEMCDETNDDEDEE